MGNWKDIMEGYRAKSCSFLVGWSRLEGEELAGGAGRHLFCPMFGLYRTGKHVGSDVHIGFLLWLLPSIIDS